MTTDYDKSIHSNPNAAAWAAFFAKTFPAGSTVPDEATMVGWFANAMMAMSDHLRAKGDEAALGKWIRAFGHLHAAVAPHAEVNMPDPEAMAREAVERLRSRSSSGSGEREDDLDPNDVVYEPSETVMNLYDGARLRGFREGVEAAARWLVEEDAVRKPGIPAEAARVMRLLSERCASRMRRALSPQGDGGTEG